MSDINPKNGTKVQKKNLVNSKNPAPMISSANASLSSNEARGRRLESARRQRGLTREYLKAHHGISASTLQSWEEGKAGGLTVKGAQKIVIAFRKEGINCTVEWLLHGTGQSPYLAQHVYLGVSEAQANLSGNVTLLNADIIARELNMFRQLNNEVLDMCINDDGMLPVYQLGDTVAGKRYFEENLEIIIGRDCIIETKSGELLCRRVCKGRKENHYHLQCISLETTVSKPFIYDAAILSAAPIIWHRRPT